MIAEDKLLNFQLKSFSIKSPVQEQINENQFSMLISSVQGSPGQIVLDYISYSGTLETFCQMLLFTRHSNFYISKV